MIATWMAYLGFVGLLAFFVARLAEPVLASWGLPRRWVWAGALVASLALPAGVGLGAGRDSWANEALVGTAATSPTTPAVAAGTGPDTVAWRWPALSPWNTPLLALWTASSGLLALWLALGAWRNRRLRARAAPGELDGQAVRRSRRGGPSVVGLFRPEIVVPDWIAALPPADRALVLAHERAHLRSRDPLLLAAADLAVVIAPWSPALWLQRSRLRRTIELDCDARVLSRFPDPSRYGRLLLTVGDRLLTHSPVPAFARPRSSLAERIDAITREQPRMSTSRILTVAAGAGLALFAGCSAPLPEPFAGSEPAAQATGPEAARESIAAYVAQLRSRRLEAGTMLLAVFDRDGRRVVEQHTKALTALGQVAGSPILGGLSPAEIASVEVIRGADRANAIVVVLSQSVPDVDAWLAARKPAGTLRMRSASASTDIVLMVDGDRVSINDQAVEAAELDRVLRAVFDGRPTKRLAVLHSPATSKERLAALLAQVNAAGITEVKQGTVPERSRVVPR